MAFNMRYIWFIVAAAIIGMWVLPAFVPAFVGITWMFLLVLGAGVVLILSRFIKPLQLPGVKKAHTIPIGLVLVVLFLLGTGTLGTILPMAAITPITTVPTVPTVAELTACQASVSPDVLGLSATLYANAYDMEANQPYSAAVDVDWFLVKNGVVQPYTDSSAETASGFSVGDVVSVYGGNASYYVTPEENICIDKQSFPLDIKAHAITSTTTGIKLTCYDSTAATACSGATNRTQEDADITLGADQEDVFYMKVQVNASNKALNFAGIATAAANDIEDVKPASGQGLTKSVVPDFLDNPISGDNGVAPGTNVSDGYDNLWVLDTPIMLHEWDEVKYKFTITAGSTDPSNNEDCTASDVAIICALDGSWARAGDGNIKFGPFQQDENEGNVGLLELTSRPIQTTEACFVIEGL